MGSRRALLFSSALCSFCYAQQDPSLSFEAATMKLEGTCKPAERCTHMIVQGGPGTADPELARFRYGSPKELILFAYGLSYDPVTASSDPKVSGPSWISNAERYEITAKLPPNTARPQFLVMVRNLLRERLNLNLHTEVRTLSGYELSVAPGGSKLVDASRGPASLPPPPAGFPRLPAQMQDQVTAGNSPIMVSRRAAGRVYTIARQQSIADIIQAMALRLNTHPGLILDRTGLSGKYDFALEAAATGLSGLFPGPQPEPDGPSLFEALEKQLGLKLEKKRIPFDVLVVDSLDRTPRPD